MAAINQIKLNSTSTTYDVNDKRITTSAVSTATHFLATDGSVSSIAPITAANAASVLGAFKGLDLPESSANIVDWDTVKGMDYCWIATWYNDMYNPTNPSAGVMICFINQSLPQSDSFRKLYIKLPHTGGVYHSYDLATWV